MALLFRTHFSLALENVRHNRGRTFLSALGIGIGVASIVLILSLTGAVNDLVGVSVKNNHANLILVRPASGKGLTENIIDELSTNNQYARSDLTLEDVKSLRRIKDVTAVAPLAISTGNIVVEQNVKPAITLVASSKELQKIAGLSLKSGGFLDATETKSVAVVGANIATKIFNNNAITKTFTYKGKRFLIVGVLNPTEAPLNFNGVDFDNAILIDAEFAADFEKSIQIQQIDITTKTTDQVPKISQTVSAILQDSRGGSDATFNVLKGSDNLHPAGSLLAIVSALLTLVASVSLIVGGVGIMNIMLVSVSERTREIGIRKAIGASSGQIMMQFLFESIVISVIGGVIGIILGYGVAFLLSLVTPFTPHISWRILVLTGATSLTVGVMFGIYPAMKAALKDPIASLKFYR